MHDPSPPDHLHSAFAFRAGYLVLAWLFCLALSGPAPSGMFPALVHLLSWALPAAAPLILWLDWRWLRSNAHRVNRFGLRRRHH